MVGLFLARWLFVFSWVIWNNKPINRWINQTTAWPHEISAHVLSSHWIVSSSRTVRVRPCSPWGGRWIGYSRTTWSTV